MSYSGEESGSFYENGNTSTQAIYSALTWLPSTKYKLELNAEFFQADYVENFGVNRPTQDLIDHNRYIKRDTRSSYYYSEVVDNSYVFDNRLEFRGKFESAIGGGKVAALTDKDGKKAVAEPSKGLSVVDKFNTGIDIRYQHVLAYDDYFNEPANAWDLSAPRSQILYQYQNSGIPIPGHPGRYAFPGTINGDTGDSNAVIGGVFVQNELRIG